MENYQNFHNEKSEEEKLKEIAEKMIKERLCIPFAKDEIKKLEIAYNFKYDANKRSKIAKIIHDRVMYEVEEILKEMKEKFFKGLND
jgi:predicted transcriptional regulator